MTIKLSKNKPYYNMALLLVSACGCTSECFRIYSSYGERWHKLASWFWSNLSPEHDPKKKPILEKINAAQGIDLEKWYWSNQ